MTSYKCERKINSERQSVGNNERRNQIIGRIGQAVNVAIERFVTIGEIIAEDNLEIKSDIFNYCKSARDAGKSIERLCGISSMDNMNYSNLDVPIYDQNAIMTAAKTLLSSITRILLLVDVAVVKQTLTAKKKLVKSLKKLESVVNFTEFVRAYSLFGIEMIELAYLMGSQQTKIKEERRRAQMFSAKQIVEHSIAILLTSSKTSLLHYDCVIAKENRDTVFCQIRRAMDLIHFVVKDCIFETPFLSFKEKTMYSRNADRDTVFSALKHFTILLESFRHPSREDNSSLYLTNNNLAKTNVISNMENNKYQRVFDSEDECLLSENNFKHANMPMSFHNRELEVIDVVSVEELLFAFDKLLEKTHDFTDSAYTSHENRESILILCERCKTEFNKYLNTLSKSEQYTLRHLLDTDIDRILCTVKDLIQQLIISVADQVVDLYYSLKSSVELVTNFHLCTINQDPRCFQECSNKFHDHCDHIADVCKLLQHIAVTETLQVQAKCLAINLRIYGPQVIIAAKILSKYPSSIPANENMDAFGEMWKWLTSEITVVAQQILDATNELMESKSLKKYKPISRPPPISQEEQEKVPSIATETKELPNELAPYNEKWNDELNDNNDIIKRAKNMSAMAFAMYQFTKGNGSLRTTQDLFTQAEYFAEEANRLYKVLRQFSYQLRLIESLTYVKAKYSIDHDEMKEKIDLMNTVSTDGKSAVFYYVSK